MAVSAKWASGDESDASPTFRIRLIKLLRQLWEGLRAIRGVKLYGVPPGGRRTPTIAFTLEGMEAEAIAAALADAGVFVSSGDFYASTVARVLGHERDGFVRAGCAAYTPAEEVERLIDGVRGLRAAA